MEAQGGGRQRQPGGQDAAVHPRRGEANRQLHRCSGISTLTSQHQSDQERAGAHLLELAALADSLEGGL